MYLIFYFSFENPALKIIHAFSFYFRCLFIFTSILKVNRDSTSIIWSTNIIFNLQFFLWSKNVSSPLRKVPEYGFFRTKLENIFHRLFWSNQIKKGKRKKEIYDLFLAAGKYQQRRKLILRILLAFYLVLFLLIFYMFLKLLGHYMIAFFLITCKFFKLFIKYALYKETKE